MEFVTRLRDSLGESLGQERFDLWFSDVELVVSADRIYVQSRTSFQLDRLRKNFQQLLREAANHIGLRGHEIVFRLSDNLAESNRQSSRAGGLPNREQGPPTLNQPTEKVGELPRLRAPSARQRGRKFHTFSTFVDGECNRIARTSAEMVITQPGDISPLLIHGPTGVGKSHLVEAIWCKSKKELKQSKILYVSAEQYTTLFLEALRGTGLPAFRRKYRCADVLIIDDIQFFAGKQATLVEFAYTIDSMARENRQIILTADRPPAQLAKLGPEIVNRLCGGLVCGMKPIDASTMANMSKLWASKRQVCLSDSMHELIASKMHGDGRQLSGVLNRLRATSVAMNEEINAKLVNDVLFELIPAPSRIIRLQDVRKTICEIFGIEESSLRTATRSRSLTIPRMLAMWFARRHTAAGLHEISQFFGRRSHSSAIAASTKVDEWLRVAEKIDINGHQCDIRDIVSQIENGLQAG